ncbi:MAG: PAS domain S-box protein, partial [Spirochaetia bacterium]
MTTRGAEYLLPLFDRVADTILGSAPADQLVVARYTAAAARAPAAASSPAAVGAPAAAGAPGAAAPVSRHTWSFLENLFANAPEGVIFADKDHRVLRVNAEFVRMFGYTSEEAAGRTIDDLVAPEDRFEEAESLSRSVESGGFVRHETRRRDKYGRELDVSLLGGPILEDGEIVGIFAIYRDISE